MTHWTVPEEVLSLLAGARAVVWDFDGVIANTEPCQAAAFAVVLQDLGISFDPRVDFKKFVGVPEAETWSRLRTLHNIGESVDELADRRSNTYIGLATQLKPAFYVDPVLRAATELGIPSVIASSGNYRHISVLLDQWEIRDAFGLVLCNGSADSAMLANKHARLAYIDRELGAPAVVIEDTRQYLLRAHEAGNLTIAVRHSFNDLSEDDGDYLLTLD